MNKGIQLIKHNIEAFEQYFGEAVKSRAPLLDRITKYIVKQKGKQMRPLFVMLSARLGGEINASTYRAAALVELLHTATLVHDDVVDDADERRGFFSINALWKNKIAVLVGDYLLSKGLLLSIRNQDFDVLKLLSVAVEQMSEGELLQIEKSRNLNLDEGVYYNIIKGKTASLLSAACGAGAFTTFLDQENVEKLSKFGELVGMAFQIKDDLFDYGEDKIGKPTGNDIREKKMTLPLIHTLNNCESQLRKKLIYLIKNENQNKEKIKFITNSVTEHGGIRYAQQKMEQFRDDALLLLYSFPPSDTRDALEDLVRFTTDRKF
jgi:octaprenyl-diphosphate synthase